MCEFLCLDHFCISLFKVENLEKMYNGIIKKQTWTQVQISIWPFNSLCDLENSSSSEGYSVCENEGDPFPINIVFNLVMSTEGIKIIKKGGVIKALLCTCL